MSESNKSVPVSPTHTVPALHIDQSLCTFCAGCSSVCPVLAIIVRDSSSEISGKCIDCGNCIAFCPVSAVKRFSGDSR